MTYITSINSSTPAALGKSFLLPNNNRGIFANCGFVNSSCSSRLALGNSARSAASTTNLKKIDINTRK